MISICIASFGSEQWRDLAWSRAYQSTVGQGAEVIVVHQPEGTCASARNAAAAEATGAWLIFLDADDELDTGYVDAMHCSANGMAMYLPRTSFARNGVRRKPHFLGDCSLRDGNPMIIGTMVPRDLFMQVGGFTEHVELFEDWMLFAQLWKAGAPVVRVPGAVYIAHMTRASRNRVPKQPTRHYWHQWIGHHVFPEHYGPTTIEEDIRKRLDPPRLRLVA